MNRHQWKNLQRNKGNGDEHTLDIQKGNYISKVWFFSKPSGGGGYDVLANLWRKLPDGVWRLSYRFRYHKDGKAFNSEDEKNFFSGTWAETITEKELWKRLDPTMQSFLTEVLPEGFTVDVTEIQSDEPQVFIEKMGKKGYINIRGPEVEA